MSTPGDEMAAFRASATTLLHRLQHGLYKPSVELVYVPHNRWPVQNSPPTQRSLKVLVLDASFNPPTLAHLSLANSFPPRSQIAETNEYPLIYDAKLLLLSVRNADKALKPGDATYPQRLEMMKIFARDVVQTYTRSEPEMNRNLAIAIIDEPTFVGKSDTLQAFFKGRFAATADCPAYITELNFILGFDTLERLIQPRYYESQEQMVASLRKFLSPAPEGDGSRVICAPRVSSSPSGGAVEGTDLSVAQEFISSGRVVFIDGCEELESYSSTEVRNTIRRLGLDAKEWKQFVQSEIADYIVRERMYVNDA